MVIVRAEDGLLADLEYIFRDVFRNFSGPTGSLPPGSIILLGSTSHLSLLGLSSYTEDYAKICSTLIGLAGPSVIVCPMIQILLSGVSSAETIRDMVNLDAWIMAGKPQDNIVLSTFRADIWETLCSKASDFVGKSPPSRALYLPLSLTNPHKKRFAAGQLKGNFPVEIDALDSTTETLIVGTLTR